MRVAKHIAVVSLALASLAAPCNAATPAPPPRTAYPQLDKKVVVDDPAIAAELKKAVGAALLSEDIARKIGPMMYADNRLTPNESDLFLELLRNVGGTIEVTVLAAGKTPADHFQVPALSPGARFFLALSDPPDLDTLWMQGPIQMKKLVDVTLLNPFVEGQVRKFIGQQFYVAWQTSNVANGYQPFKSAVSTSADYWHWAGPMTEAQAKKLAYAAITDLNKLQKGAISSNLYARLKP